MSLLQAYFDALVIVLAMKLHTGWKPRLIMVTKKVSEKWVFNYVLIMYSQYGSPFATHFVSTAFASF